MEAVLLFLVLLLVALPIGIVIALVNLYGDVRRLREELSLLKIRVDPAKPQPATRDEPGERIQPAMGKVAAVAQTPVVHSQPVAIPPQISPERKVPEAPVMATPVPELPPLIVSAAGQLATVDQPEQSWFEKVNRAAPIDWEKFMGVKLFAWVGGLAMFLGIVFFVKHAFEHGLIPPEMRVALGFLAGLAMVVGGAVLHRRNYQMPAQSLCATGILVLYGTTFACRSVYHFAWFGQVPTFLLMALITAGALVLALRLEALVVAVLGMVGGFLTPALLSTGQDNPLALFSYIALLDAGLLALAFHRRWHFLAFMSAVGTILLELGWMTEFFVREQYFVGNKILIAMAVFAWFTAMFSAAWWWGHRRAQTNYWLSSAAIMVAAVALMVVPFWIGFESLAQRPGLIFLFVLGIDLALLGMAWAEKRLVLLEPAAGGAVFLLLTIWMGRHLEDSLLYWALGLVFLFALFHSAIPILRRKWQPGLPMTWWSHLFPLVALLLMLIPLFRLEPAPISLWPFMLLLNLLVLGLAMIWGSAVGLLGAIGLTLLLAICWILRLPPSTEHLLSELIVTGAFGLFFVAAGMVLVRRMARLHDSAEGGAMSIGFGAFEIPTAWIPQIPALSAVLPFTLLLLISQRLPLPDPAPVFAVAGLLVALLLGLSIVYRMGVLPMVALGCSLALQYAWHQQHFIPAQAVRPLLWHIGFILVFAGAPFLFWRRMQSEVWSWVTAALAGPLHFYLVYRHVNLAWPNDYMGIIPLLFTVPAALGLFFLLRHMPAGAPNRNTLLAWFGGTTLFFITLIFPIQFERQWITVGWALEGAALLWLFHRVPHHGLRLTGFGLLTLAFVRLALNPSVLSYHMRGEIPILNWYLYTYGLVIASLFVGARLLAPPHHIILQNNARSILLVFGTILSFLLLNIQIADYFTVPGSSSLVFQFSGHFGRDMTYSIAWAAFALGMLVVGIWKCVPPARYAALALLSFTLLKLFFHDLSQLSQLYRIGAFISVAIIAMLASFLYQRFFLRTANADSSPTDA